VLLERALRSTAAQTVLRWRCIVFDDCPQKSAKAVVESMNDERFVYQSNDRPLGAPGNIDQCFRNLPYVGGHYACVVEDDNYLFPQHLETQLKHCVEQKVDVTLSAQFCERATMADEVGELTEEKTIAWIYPEGLHDHRALLLSVLFSHAFSNGSVFWKLGCASNFEIGALTEHAGIQETLRMLRLQDRVYVSHQPTAVWRSNACVDSYVNVVRRQSLLGKLSAIWADVNIKREIMDYRMHYIDRYGLADVLANVHNFDSHHYAEIERSMLLCGKNVRLTKRPAYWRGFQIARGHLFRLLIRSDSKR
jgi:hypothetical protein